MFKRSAALSALILLQSEALLAKEIKLPASGPVLVLDVPDDWTLVSGDVGLEAISPEKNSYLFMKILKRPVDDPNQWVKAVKEELRAHGFSFGKLGAAPAQEAKAEPAPPVAHAPSGDSAAKPTGPAQSPAASVSSAPQLAPTAPVAPEPAAAAPTPAVNASAPAAPAAATPTPAVIASAPTPPVSASAPAVPTAAAPTPPVSASAPAVPTAAAPTPAVSASAPAAPAAAAPTPVVSATAPAAPAAAAPTAAVSATAPAAPAAAAPTPAVSASAPEAPAAATPATSPGAATTASVSPKPPEAPSVAVQKAQTAAPSPGDKKVLASPIPFFAEADVTINPPSEAQTPLIGDPSRSIQSQRFPRHVLSYNDASFDGKPVDLQLVTTILPDHSVLFMIQESAGTDARAITAINSLRPLK